MRIIARKTLKNFYEKKENIASKKPLEAWFLEAKKACWKTPNEIKEQYRNVSFVSDKVIFNIKGNDYRLVVHINYEVQVIYIKFIGTHKEYDKIDVRLL